MFKVLNLVKVVNTLVTYGRPVNVALRDVITSYGLTRMEAVELIRLVR